jgi:hypothetical protein
MRYAALFHELGSGVPQMVTKVEGGEGVIIGEECVYVKVSESQTLEKYL